MLSTQLFEDSSLWEFLYFCATCVMDLQYNLCWDVPLFYTSCISSICHTNWCILLQNCPNRGLLSISLEKRRWGYWGAHSAIVNHKGITIRPSKKLALRSFAIKSGVRDRKTKHLIMSSPTILHLVCGGPQWSKNKLNWILILWTWCSIQTLPS